MCLVWIMRATAHARGGGCRSSPHETCLSANRRCRETLRPGLQDVLRALGHHQLEVLDEASRKCIVLAEIFVAAGPRIGRVQYLRRHSFALHRHLEAK